VIAFQTPKRGLEAILACETTERVCPIAVALRHRERERERSCSNDGYYTIIGPINTKTHRRVRLRLLVSEEMIYGTSPGRVEQGEDGSNGFWVQEIREEPTNCIE
jgi:hypothetical protein